MLNDNLIKALGIDPAKWRATEDPCYVFRDTLEKVGYDVPLNEDDEDHAGPLIYAATTCCGVREICDVVSKEEVVKAIARALPHSCGLIVYYSVDDERTRDFEEFGFVRGAEFLNPGTGNDITVLTLNTGRPYI